MNIRNRMCLQLVYRLNHFNKPSMRDFYFFQSILLKYGRSVVCSTHVDKIRLIFISVVFVENLDIEKSELILLSSFFIFSSMYVEVLVH